MLTPFCCRRITPQAPFHKFNNYPRSYTCVFDFVNLATAIPGHVPTSQLTKPLADHDFVVGVSKGHRDPAVGPNQWGASRYYVPDSRVLGGLVEVATNEDKTQLEPLLKDPDHQLFVHLEDVWVSLLCPVHVQAVWFIQLWVRNARSQQELEDVTNRVRARRTGDPSLVEDDFTVRFNEMRGTPNARLNPPRVYPRGPTIASNPRVDTANVNLWRDHTAGPSVTEPANRASMDPPPGLGFSRFKQSPSLSQLHLLSGVNQPSPTSRIGNTGINPAAAPFINRGAYQLGPSGHPVPGNVPELGAFGQPRPAENPFEASTMTSISNFQRNIQTLGFPPPVDDTFGKNPYTSSKPNPATTGPPQYQQPSVSEDPEHHDSSGAFFPTTRQPKIPPNPESSRGFENQRLPPGSFGSVPRLDDPFVDPPAGGENGSAQAASAYAPFAGNTGGLRPVKKRTWDLEKKEWVEYWVWAL